MEKVTTSEKAQALGTRLVSPPGTFRYAHAGGPLKANRPAYSPGGVEIPRDAEGHLIIGQEQSDGFWSNLQAEGEELFMMGWPVVDVEPGQYFWLRERQ